MEREFPARVRDAIQLPLSSSVSRRGRLNSKSTSPIPEPIAQLQRQLEQFRSTRPQRRRLSGSMSGLCKPNTVWIMRHRQTKGSETDRPDLTRRATSRLYKFGAGACQPTVVLNGRGGLREARRFFGGDPRRSRLSSFAAENRIPARPKTARSSLPNRFLWASPLQVN